MKFLRCAVLAAVAFVSVVSPSYAGVENLGQRTKMESSSDTVTKQEVVAVTAPDSNPSVQVNVTTHYLHDRWWPWSDQVYYIKTQGTAEHVARLGYWVYKDADGKLFRFNKGSAVGIETPRQTIDIGAQGSVISASDRAQNNGVSAGPVSADNSTRSFNVSTRYTHVETYNDVTYTVASTTTGRFVAEQNAHMVWVGSTLYKATNGSNAVQALSDRPTANVGVLAQRISANDQMVSSNPTVTAGSVQANGRTRILNVARDYINVQEYQKLRYTLQHEEVATYVAEQGSHMAWISNNLYRVRVGSDVVQLMQARPVVNAGGRIFKIDFSDPLVSVDVTPVSLTSDSKSIVVNVYHRYKHEETFQVKEYYMSSTEIARYNETYKVWTVIVDGRIYAIAFAGDTVTNNNGDVVIIKAPDTMKRPDVIVVNPGNGEPPVVVPGKKNPSTDTDPPVVVPGKKKPVDNDPPVVVPNKKKGPVVIDNGDDDGPAVVVPRR